MQDKQPRETSGLYHEGFSAFTEYAPPTPGGRLLRRALCLLAVLGLLALSLPPPATARVLVSNLDRPPVPTTNPVGNSELAWLSLYDHAQGFRTGTTPAGSVLTSIDFKVLTALGDTVPKVVLMKEGSPVLATLTLRQDKTTTLGAGTGSSTNISNPDNYRVNTFDAPWVLLDPNTTYFVAVISCQAIPLGGPHMRRTRSDAEDSDGLSDWSVNDRGLVRGQEHGPCGSTQPPETGWSVFETIYAVGEFGPFYPKLSIRVHGHIIDHTRSFAEQVADATAAATNIGAPIPAPSAVSGSGRRYSLSGPHATLFDITDTGQLRTKAGVNYDYEAQASYPVGVTVTKGDNSVTLGVRIALTNVVEPPVAPTALTVNNMPGQPGALQATWEAPANAGRPPILSYDRRIRQSETEAWSEYSPPSFFPEVKSQVTYSSLAPNTIYEVQVRARNAEGVSPWTASGSARTLANTPPVFPSATENRLLNEDIGDTPRSAETNIGASLTATDPDKRPRRHLRYVLSGTDAALFALNTLTGQLTTKAGVRYDYEAVQPSYAVTVTVRDTYEAITLSEHLRPEATTDTATVEVTIILGDVNEPPLKPSAPTVSAVTGSATSLQVTVTAPTNTGRPAISGYDLRYRPNGASMWTDGPQDESGPSVTLTGLIAATHYTVQVKAKNAEGESPWSDSGGGQTNSSGTDRRTNTDGTDSNGKTNVPAAPGAPTVEETGLDTVTVSWTVPDNTGPPITGYDFQYHAGAGGAWTDGPQDQAGTGVEVGGLTLDSVRSAEIGGLTPDGVYHVRVRAQNSAGDGAWSAAGFGTTALWAATLTVGALDSRPRGYWGFQRTSNTFGRLSPSAFTYDRVDYRVVVLAWFRGFRRDNLGSHTAAVDFYTLDNALPDNWVLRVDTQRFLSSNGRRATLTFSRQNREKIYWTDPGIALTLEETYTVALSRVVGSASEGNGSGTVPLTADFAKMPQTHDGSTAFTFTVEFSEEIDISSYLTFYNAVFEVSGGTVTGARRLAAPSNQRWEITVEPAGDEDVVLVLPADRACDTAGAICSESGKRLSTRLAATVAGPALSADATLAALTLSGIDIGTFDSEHLTYTATVAGTVSSTTVTATPTDGNATVSIVPADTATATAIHEVSLAEGVNTITVTVTAEDGTTTRAYTVTVVRPNRETDKVDKVDDHLVDDATKDDGSSGTRTGGGSGGGGSSGSGTGSDLQETHPVVGYLENPGPNSFQSGIGVLSGWVCEGEDVVIELNGEPQAAAYGTERVDTRDACGDTDNGFGLLFNWNLLGDGEHEVVAYVDDVELGRATVQVTTLGAEFLRDVAGECTVADFPTLGETVTLEWQQNSQNFGITDVE